MTTKTVLFTPHACTLEVSVHMSAGESRRLAFELLRHARASEGIGNVEGRNEDNTEVAA